MRQPSNAPNARATLVHPATGALRWTRSGGTRRRLIGAVGGILLVGALAAGCGGAGSASGGDSGSKLLASTRHTSASGTTTTTAVQTCGSNRDPFDPTGSAPPAGSPAIC
jgi:hypothetical protein